ncbi:MAG: hypothetical protein IJV99_01845 [Clostridia bacterium]|nr:hypothetical protein [Clostridia bacterium]
MFNGCVNLLKAPKLPASTLAMGCYEKMFYGCGKINEVTILATEVYYYPLTDVNVSDCLNRWLYGTAETGTIIKMSEMQEMNKNSSSGIPVGWNVQDYNS